MKSIPYSLIVVIRGRDKKKEGMIEEMEKRRNGMIIRERKERVHWSSLLAGRDAYYNYTFLFWVGRA